MARARLEVPGMAREQARLRLAALVLASAVRLAQGQVYELTNVPLPPAKSLQVLQAFYVFGDGQTANDVSKDTVAPPFVKFELRANGTNKDGSLNIQQETLTTGVGVQSVIKGVEVGLVPAETLGRLISTRNLCGEALPELTELSKAGLLVQVPFAEGGDGHGTVVFESKKLDGGIYYLVHSNCANSSSTVAVNGKVVVKNPHGYLPGDEYYTKSCYGWLAVVYGLLAFIWAALMLRWYTETVGIHKGILMVIGIGLAETVTLWWSLSDANASGIRSGYMACLTDVLSAVKIIVSYVLLIAVSKGWGVMTEDLEDCATRCKLHVVSLVFLPALYFARGVLTYRHSQRFAEPLMYGSLLVVAVVNAIMLFWVFSYLSETSMLMKQRNMEKATALFGQIWSTVLFAAVLGVGPLLAHVADIMQGQQLQMWQLQSLLQEGGGGAVFLVALVRVMCTLAPNQDSLQYEFTAVSAEEGSKEESAPVVWVDDDTLEEEGGFGPGPSTYGARTAQNGGHE